jgi:hypothetical protein
VWMIAHHEGITKTHLEVFGCPTEKVGIWLNALTLVCTTVRADVDGRDCDSRISQSGDNVRIDPVHIVDADRSFSHARLICHNKEQKMVLEPTQAVDGAGIKDHITEIGQVASVLDQGAVAVPKYRGSRSIHVIHCSSLVSDRFNEDVYGVKSTLGRNAS